AYARKRSSPSHAAKTGSLPAPPHHLFGTRAGTHARSIPASAVSAQNRSRLLCSSEGGGSQPRSRTFATVPKRLAEYVRSPRKASIGGRERASMILTSRTAPDG